MISLTWKTLSELLAFGSGITSRLNRNSGTQKPWITSAEAIWNSMRLPVGTTSTGISVTGAEGLDLVEVQVGAVLGVHAADRAELLLAVSLSTPSGLETMAALRAWSAPS